MITENTIIPSSTSHLFRECLVLLQVAVVQRTRINPSRFEGSHLWGWSKFRLEGYYNLYKRRLLPVLEFINEHAIEDVLRSSPSQGSGCGQFAGDFHGQLGHELQKVFIRLLHDHGNDFQNIKGSITTLQ